MKGTDQYTELFQAQRRQIDAYSLPQLNARRDAAAEAFGRLGFPSLKVENYRYTDVAAAFAPNYGLKLNNQLPSIPREGEADALRLYGTLADVQTDAITALNTMLVQDVVVVHVPAGVRKEHPIQVSQYLSSKVPLMQNRRLLVAAEAGAHVRLLLSDKAEEGQDFLTTQVTELFVGEGATVEFYDIEQLHDRCHRFHQFYADVAQGGHFTHTVFTLTGGLSRNTTQVRLSGAGAEASLYGCAVIDGTQHCDNNTLIDHAVTDCRSNELYKYVVDQHAVGAFAGRVLVRPGADRTDSRETNANLVCSTEARVYSQPMLEIYADDVKCSHGSTVGQLNADALFYMRQRGISETDARLLLKQAFASEVINSLPYEALRSRLQLFVDQRFRGELNHCRTCNLCAPAQQMSH